MLEHIVALEKCNRDDEEWGHMVIRQTGLKLAAFGLLLLAANSASQVAVKEFTAVELHGKIELQQFKDIQVLDADQLQVIIDFETGLEAAKARQRIGAICPECIQVEPLIPPPVPPRPHPPVPPRPHPPGPTPDPCSVTLHIPGERLGEVMAAGNAQARELEIFGTSDELNAFAAKCTNEQCRNFRYVGVDPPTSPKPAPRPCPPPTTPPPQPPPQ